MCHKRTEWWMIQTVLFSANNRFCGTCYQTNVFQKTNTWICLRIDATPNFLLDGVIFDVIGGTSPYILFYLKKYVTKLLNMLLCPWSNQSNELKRNDLRLMVRILWFFENCILRKKANLQLTQVKEQIIWTQWLKLGLKWT